MYSWSQVRQDLWSNKCSEKLSFLTNIISREEQNVACDSSTVSGVLLGTQAYRLFVFVCGAFNACFNIGFRCVTNRHVKAASVFRKAYRLGESGESVKNIIHVYSRQKPAKHRTLINLG